MAVYYFSACHDCKTSMMWEKCPIETAEVLHKDYHAGHNTELGSDMDDDFYGVIWKYESEFEGTQNKKRKEEF